MKKPGFQMLAVMITAAFFLTSCIPTTGGVATAPTLSATAIASSITTSSAISGGTITSNGGATITASGIVWGTTSNPTIALSTKTITSPVITSGAFIGTVSGLTSGATYYVRAYATNSVGTGYGPQISFVATTGGTSSDIPAVFTNHFTSAVTLSTEG
ncbi:MAG: hypothetical protein JWN78_136, partial [Bacteroidota bacterium]|nr:hypothetical protein [Bacteroidota bacterium]